MEIVSRKTLRPARWPAALLSLVVVGCLAACADPAATAAEPSGALVVVVGGRANAAPPALSGVAASARDVAVAQQSVFSLVLADGAPFAEGPAATLTADAADAGAREEQYAANRERVDDAVAGARARTPESDLLTAIDLGVQTVGTPTGLRTLVLVDSGLSTAGALDFTAPGMLDADPREVADTLADSNQLPDLRGWSVVFQGLGDTAAPQPPLDDARRAQLASIWTEVLQRAGAVAVQRGDVRLTGDPDPALPAVRTVAIEPGMRCTGGSLTLTGGPLGFRPGEPTLLDESAAAERLRPYAEQLIARPGVVAEVFGTSPAVGDPEVDRQISEDRAQEVANLLIDLGVPIPQLHVLGLGSDFDGHVPDRDTTGHLVPAAAALNRTIRIDFTEPVQCV
ncbi:OmpA family protein [Modestobacter excelsi]|uniref:OmpA family protein n=1 Tax=Modestobacter excelsi TaxID=2213161 RepID=UPI00110CCEB0|nr:OmpA family protein [Modestobacter excelsi]